MALKVEDIEDQSKYRQMLKIPYDELIDFILDYLRRKTGLMYFFWTTCPGFSWTCTFYQDQYRGLLPLQKHIHAHDTGNNRLSLACIPVHELLHIIPYYLTGARDIRIGMDMKQYMVYVAAHRYVTTKGQYHLVALFPFISMSIVLIYLVFTLPGLWKWSLSLLTFVHATMCAGDFAMLNFYAVHPGKKIYTWDDFDDKTAYFYEEI